jgi:hypothetical protein
MKRLFLMLVAALAAAALLAGIGTASDSKGPACTNFSFGDPFYINGTAGADMTLAAPACTGETHFSLDIYSFTSDGTGTPLVADVPPSTVSGSMVSFSYTFPAGTAPSDGVCLVATSYWRDHVADRAPDTGCQKVAAGSSGGGGGMN